MLSRPFLQAAAVAALVVGLSACGDGAATTAKTTPSASSAPSHTTPVSPATAATTAPPVPRTVAGLKSALLDLKDLPSGFSIEAAGDSGDGGGTSSKDPKCAALVKITNAKVAQGSKGSAEVSFSGGQGGPFITESIDAMGSTAAVGVLQKSLESAAATCRQLVLTIPGQGSSAVKVAEVSAPQFGDHPLAARMSATTGPLAGLEITLVTTGVNDTMVSLNFVGATAEDVDGATEAAVSKAQEVLGKGLSRA